MTERVPEPYGDALSAPFWEAARRRELVLQRCASCGAFQFYPRPFCLACGSDEVEWAEASGRGVVESTTTVRIPVLQELAPPYAVGLVALDEGPMLLTNLPLDCPIGARVRVAWRERGDDPPLPVFERPDEEGGEL